LAATAHSGADGRLFVYLLNGGKEPSARLKLGSLRQTLPEAEASDLLNGGFSKRFALQDGEAEMELPLPPGKAALLELKGLALK
jgi:hypothetical protein